MGHPWKSCWHQRWDERQQSRLLLTRLTGTVLETPSLTWVWRKRMVTTRTSCCLWTLCAKLRYKVLFIRTLGLKWVNGGYKTPHHPLVCAPQRYPVTRVSKMWVVLPTPHREYQFTGRSHSNRGWGLWAHCRHCVCMVTSDGAQG